MPRSTFRMERFWAIYAWVARLLIVTSAICLLVPAIRPIESAVLASFLYLFGLGIAIRLVTAGQGK
jgi:hypothetical protein